MEVLSVSGARWVDAEHTAITCNAIFKGHGELPFTASPLDPEPYGRALFTQLANGDHGYVMEPDEVEG